MMTFIGTSKKISTNLFMFTRLSNFFFVPQDLTDRINSYFQIIAFRRNLLLIGLTLHVTSFL